MGHPPRVPVWIGWEKSVIYFITICVADRKLVLANNAAFSAFKRAVARLRHWKVLAAVVMPDHLHVIVAPTRDRDAKVGNFSGALKRWIREELGASWKCSLVVLIASCARMNPSMRNGYISKKILCARASLVIPEIGHTKSAWMKMIHD